MKGGPTPTRTPRTCKLKKCVNALLETVFLLFLFLQSSRSLQSILKYSIQSRVGRVGRTDRFAILPSFPKAQHNTTSHLQLRVQLAMPQP